jgi:hypothetical protein
MTLKKFPPKSNPGWPDVVQLEQSMPVLAGQGHPSNWQARALAERTDYLKKTLDSFVVPELPENVTGGLSVQCSNEVVVIQADKNGTASSYANTGCILKVFEGAEQLQCSPLSNMPGTWKVTSVGTDITPGLIAISGKDALVNNVVSMPDNKTQARIVFTIEGMSKGGVPFVLVKHQLFTKFAVVNGKDGIDGDSKDGEDGKDGRPGTKSVSRSISGTSWSDAEALQAFVDWGAEEPVTPMLGDMVTLYNVTAKFSEMREYTDTGWVPVVSRIPGMAIMAQSITTEQLLIGSMGAAISPDPNTQDITAWSGVGISLVNDPSAPNGTSAISMTGEGEVVLSRPFPFDRTKNHLVRSWYRAVGTTSKASLLVQFLDAGGLPIDGSNRADGWPATAQYHCYGLVDDTVPNVWTQYQVAFGPNEVNKIPINARFMQIGAKANLTEAGTQYFSGMYVQQKTDGQLLVDGAVTARAINAQGLTIRNELNQVLLDASGGSIPPWLVALENTEELNTLSWARPPDTSNRSQIRSLKVDGETLTARYSSSDLSIELSSNGRDVWSSYYVGEFHILPSYNTIPVWNGYHELSPNSTYILELQLRPRVTYSVGGTHTMSFFLKVPDGASGYVLDGTVFNAGVDQEVTLGTADCTTATIPVASAPVKKVLIQTGSTGGAFQIRAKANTYDMALDPGTRFILEKLRNVGIPQPYLARVGEVITPPFSGDVTLIYHPAHTQTVADPTVTFDSLGPVHMVRQFPPMLVNPNTFLALLHGTVTFGYDSLLDCIFLEVQTFIVLDTSSITSGWAANHRFSMVSDVSDDEKGFWSFQVDTISPIPQRMNISQRIKTGTGITYVSEQLIHSQGFTGLGGTFEITVQPLFMGLPHGPAWKMQDKLLIV